LLAITSHPSAGPVRANQVKETGLKQAAYDYRTR
jgi:hypothetical protein